MTAPTEYDRQTSFALFSAEFPGQPHSGNDLDEEFNAVKLSVDATQAALALIQRSDGTLQEGIVGAAQLDETISLGVTSRGVWVTDTDYTADIEVVFHDTKVYRCAVTHTSGTFATDLAAAKWVELADFGVQVLDVDTVDEEHLVDEAVTEAKIRGAAVTTDKIASTAVTLAKLATEVVNRLVPAGTVVPYAGTTEPSGWLFPYGQAVAQATYPSLYAAIGTTYNTGGEGAGNFRLPDLRGRVVPGKDNMGGSSANRLTDADDGLNGDTLGDTGGVETQVLVQGNLPNVNFTVSGITLSNPAPTGITLTNLGTLKGNVITPSGTDAVVGIGGAGAAITLTQNTQNTTVATQGTAASGGSGTAFGVVQPSIILNYLIKAH